MKTLIILHVDCDISHEELGSYKLEQHYDFPVLNNVVCLCSERFAIEKIVLANGIQEITLGVNITSKNVLNAEVERLEKSIEYWLWKE